VAVRAAEENVRRNGLEGVVRIAEAGSPLGFEGTAEVVVANIVADVIISMAEDLAAKLKPGGKLIASGIVRERAGDVNAGLEAAGIATLEQRTDGEWLALVCGRRKPS